MNNLGPYLGLIGSLFLAVPSIVQLVQRKGYKTFLDTYKNMAPQQRQDDKTWRAARDSMLLNLITWSRFDAWFLLLGAGLLCASFLAELLR